MIRNIGNRDCLLLILLLATGAVFRLPQIPYGNPAVRDPDAHFTVDVARNLSMEWRAGRAAFDPHSYFYPTCYLNTLATAGFLTGTREMEEKARALALISSLLLCLIAFLLGRRLANPQVGLMSAAIISTGFIFIKQGLRPAPDSFQTLFIAIALLFLVRSPLTNHDILWGGFWTGVGVGTKYLAGLFVIPVVLVSQMTHIRDKSPVLIFKELSLWIFFSILGFFISSPQLFFYPRVFFHFLLSQRAIQKWGVIGHHPKNVWTLIISSSSSAVESPFSNSLVGMLGTPFVVMIAISLVYMMVKTKKEEDPRWLGMSLSVVISYLYFSLGSQIVEVRYLLPTIAMASILVAVTIDDISLWISSRSSVKRVRRRFFSWVILCLLMLPSLSLACRFLVLLSKIDTRVACAEWIIQNIPPGKKVLNFMFGPSLPAGRYKPFQWYFPEYMYDLSQYPNSGPTIERLKSEGIEWVIWNSFYTNKFSEIPGSSLEKNYFLAWRHFYMNLERLADKKEAFKTEEGLGPAIEVFHVPLLTMQKQSEKLE